MQLLLVVRHLFNIFYMTFANLLIKTVEPESQLSLAKALL